MFLLNPFLSNILSDLTTYNMRKYSFLLTLFLSCKILFLYERICFCLYAEEYGSVKTRIRIFHALSSLKMLERNIWKKWVKASLSCPSRVSKNLIVWLLLKNAFPYYLKEDLQYAPGCEIKERNNVLKLTPHPFCLS